MIRKYLFPILALAGFIFGLWMVMQSEKPVPASAPIADPPRSPFSDKISGSGIVESGTRNISIAAPVSGIVTRVFVRVSDRVREGDTLFMIDDRQARAALNAGKTKVAEARKTLERLLKAPRKESVPPLRAKVSEARAELENLKFQLQTAESITDPGALSREELNNRRYAVQTAEARLALAKANLALQEAGAWQADIDVAEAVVAGAEAEVQKAETDIDLLRAQAPVEGSILQVNIRPGEYAQSAVVSPAPILLGNLDRLHVRADINENDAWRFRPDARAVASVRGNSKLKTQLTYEYTEPYVIPKRSLTGDSTERVDTRVLQVVYSFSRQDLAVYPGQLMDVFIEDLSGTDAPPSGSRSSGESS
ncbi:MAG: biotin/lipoyl-binding protein [Desulfobacterales bacterium]|nr:biotin/lipoyl-binding protein [Desulfobacterales bacterium]MDD4391742.1 biotin/lipoyl-binding protein [Desulfobacterales bacterium]